MPYPKYKPVDVSLLKHNSPSDEEILIQTDKFASPFIPCSTFSSFVESLPHSGAAGKLKKLSGIMKRMRAGDFTISWLPGEEFLTGGLAPVLIDLMERGWVSSVSITDTFLLRDFETAYSGRILNGTSISEEALIFLNVAMREGVARDVGVGECIGSYIGSSDFIFKDASVLHRAFKLNIPVTVHFTTGTPAFNISSVSAEDMHRMGEKDFRLFLSVIDSLKDDGIVVSAGSNYSVFRLLADTLGVFRGAGHFTEDIKIAKFGGDSSDKVRSLEFDGDLNILIPLFAALILNP